MSRRSVTPSNHNIKVFEFLIKIFKMFVLPAIEKTIVQFSKNNLVVFKYTLICKW